MEQTPTEQLKQLETEYRQKRAELEQAVKGGLPSEASAKEGANQETAPVPSEQETLSQVVEGTIQQHVPAFQAGTHAGQATDDSATADTQAKIQNWVNLAFSQGISAGVKVAKDSNDLALIDSFHAALTGELYKMLVEQKKLVDISP